MHSRAEIRELHSQRHNVVRSLCARAIWSRFASPRVEVHLSPSNSRPNLFAGD